MSVKDLQYLEYQLNNKTIYVVKHHAVALKCWLIALEAKKIHEKAFLLHIDKHSDLNLFTDNIEKSTILLRFTPTEIDEFIQNDLDQNNSEFIVNALISGLIGTGISIHYEDNRNSKYVQVSQGYDRDGTSDHFLIPVDEKEYKMYLWDTQDLTGLFYGRHSLFGDPILHLDVKEEFNQSENVILDIDFKFFTYSRNLFNSEWRSVSVGPDVLNLFFQEKDIILDIDLDFFTQSYGKTYSKNKRDIRNQIFSSAFSEFINRSNVITIALEPTYCGSKENCLEILEVFCERFQSLDLDEISGTFFSDD